MFTKFYWIFNPQLTNLFIMLLNLIAFLIFFILLRLSRKRIFNHKKVNNGF